MAVSKKIRFEVFKRDSFTCQYCGKKAPDVVLHVDHIHPKAEGGDDDILNLVTSCRDCNLGKGPRLLDDVSVLEKRRAQLEELQERREQIDMMVDWHRSLASEKEHALESASEYWAGLLKEQYELNETGRSRVSKLIRRFGLDEVLGAMDISIAHYIQFDKEGHPTPDSVETSLQKIGGICFNRRRYAQDPAEEQIDQEMWRFVRLFGERCSGGRSQNELRGWWRQHVHPVLRERPEWIPLAAEAAVDALEDLHVYMESWRIALNQAADKWPEYLSTEEGGADA